MAFKQKTWTDRVAEFINRRLLTKEDGSTELVMVARSEGTVSTEGDGFTAKNMNDLEQRIANEFSELNNALEEAGTVRYNPLTDMIELKLNGTWYPWKKALLQAISIYAEGLINTDLVGNLIGSGSSGTSGSTSFDTNCITIKATGTTSSSRRQTVRSEKTIDLTDIEMICADFSMEIESTSTSFNLAVSTTIPSDVTTITNKVELNSVGTAQLDVSGLTGNYYLFAFVTSKVSGQVVRVSNIYMS